MFFTTVILRKSGHQTERNKKYKLKIGGKPTALEGQYGGQSESDQWQDTVQPSLTKWRQQQTIFRTIQALSEETKSVIEAALG